MPRKHAGIAAPSVFSRRARTLTRLIVEVDITGWWHRLSCRLFLGGSLTALCSFL